MKHLLFILAAAAPLSAFAAPYQLKITNGSSMPLSESVIYVTSSSPGLAPVGSKASPGFIRLCQMGNAEARLMEVKGQPGVSSVQKTMGHLAPGQSVTVEVELRGPEDTVHFESMYGKTKDVCAVFDADARDLGLKSAVTGRDEVVVTGAFRDPQLPMGKAMACEQAANAVACLRELAMPASSVVRFFPGYLPSVVSFLEKRFGAAETQTLLIPTSGAVRFELSRK